MTLNNSRLFEGIEMEYSSMAKSVAWSQSNRACFSVTEDKTEGRKTYKQAATQDGCSEDLAKHLQGGNSEFGDVHGLQTTGSHWLQRIFIQVLKLCLYLQLCQILLSPWKWRYFA